MMLPRVLVGCPTSDHKAYCLREYAQALHSLTYENADILLVDNSETSAYAKKIKELGIPVIKDTYLPKAKDRIVHSRNILRQTALDNGYDYFFSLEQDVIPPSDIIERLLNHHKPITTGIYFTTYIIHGKEEIRPVLWKALPDQPDNMTFLDTELNLPQLVPLKACGLGCILIHRDVLERVSFRLYQDRNKQTFDDIGFCHDATQQGYPIYAYTGVKCKHLIAGMNWDAIKE